MAALLLLRNVARLQDETFLHSRHVTNISEICEFHIKLMVALAGNDEQIRLECTVRWKGLPNRCLECSRWSRALNRRRVICRVSTPILMLSL